MQKYIDKLAKRFRRATAVLGNMQAWAPSQFWLFSFKIPWGGIPCPGVSKPLRLRVSSSGADSMSTENL
jgi:hypothetical protein